MVQSEAVGLKLRTQVRSSTGDNAMLVEDFRQTSRCPVVPLLHKTLLSRRVLLDQPLRMYPGSATRTMAAQHSELAISI